MAYHGASLVLVSPWAPCPLAYVLRWTAWRQGWSSAVRAKRAGRAAVRASEDARSVVDLKKLMAADV